MSFSLPDSIALDLLHKLGHDDAFRDRFVSDTRSALAELGFAAAADESVSAGIWKCLSVNTLANKDSVRASHAALFKQITSERGAQHPISLEINPSYAKSAA